MALNGTMTDEKIWNFFIDKGIPATGVAGLIGNLDYESALNPKNMENQYESKLGFTDDRYTAAVDNGSYKNFVNDAVGYGLLQVTWWTRKQAMQLLAKSMGVSIGDMEMQLCFIWQELAGSYKSVLDALIRAGTPEEASNIIMLRYEQPADQSVSAQNRRAAYAKKYYEKFARREEQKMDEFVCTLSPIGGYYHFKKGSRIQLSKNFWSYEFDCHGKGCCTETIISAKLVSYCQQIRDHFGTSVSISSPYRCIIHNSRTSNAATNSRHTKGDAADIVVSGHTPREVAQYCESIGILGIGLYETSSDGYFVHIDVRDYKSFWYGQACVARTTFGGSQIATAKESSTSSLLMMGSRGTDVKDLQNSLIALGYDLGNCGADGEYGYATYMAVKEFQKDSGLAQDGIAGNETLKAIEASREEEYVVTASILNVRSGAGTEFAIVGVVNKNTILTVSKVRNSWGFVGNGWVSMQYLRRKG